MGEILTINRTQLRPTQNYLINKHIEKYRGQALKLIPVTKDEVWGIGYNILDGHHRLSSIIEENPVIQVWVANSPRDFIPTNITDTLLPEEIEEHNFQIKKRFTTSQMYVPIGTHGKEIFSFDDFLKYHYKINSKS